MIQGQTTAHQTQMSFLEPTEQLWCERTQDMSGYILPDITLPLSDEFSQSTISTAQIENDIDVQNSHNLSHEEFFMGNQTEEVLGVATHLVDEAEDMLLHLESKIPPPTFTEVLNEEIKQSAANYKKSGCLSRFDCEEPYIKDDIDSLSYCCTDSKPVYDIKDEMDVAEEVVVTTEEQEPERSEYNHSPFMIHSPFPGSFVEPREEVVSNSAWCEKVKSPLRISCDMETPFDLDINFDEEDDFLRTFEDQPPEVKPSPALQLDIAAALASNQLLLEPLPDTPDVLKPVLSPGLGFDLVNYLLTNSDSNTNGAVGPSQPAACVKSPREERVGKSRLSLSQLMESQRTPSPEPTPGPSREDNSFGRPSRKSATKFKKLLAEGFLSPTDYPSDLSDGEDSPTPNKRRRTSSSSSSRRCLNSDSDMSNVNESQKYRERRDRNNLSSRKSRQKRKYQQELKKLELRQLEEENKRLKKRAGKLAATLDRVHAAWKEYLMKMKKENR